MNKSELISAVAEKTNTSLAEAKQSVEATLEVISEQLKSGGDVRIPGFGTFGTKTRAARTGTNPATGQKMEIAARTVPTFSAGSQLKAAASSAGPVK